eukprot:5270200-Prymnesium_polylepis.1
MPPAHTRRCALAPRTDTRLPHQRRGRHGLRPRLHPHAMGDPQEVRAKGGWGCATRRTRRRRREADWGAGSGPQSASQAAHAGRRPSLTPFRPMAGDGESDATGLALRGPWRAGEASASVWECPRTMRHGFAVPQWGGTRSDDTGQRGEDAANTST